ncbi:MAG TPA: hypothetical protein VK610_09900 [Rhodothermales bacterium]|nr:hypothetical protein [Rhodothermales bacterium]
MRVLLLVALLPLLAAAGCRTAAPSSTGVDTGPTATPAEPPPALGRPFTLARGQAARLGDLTVTFTAVLEDSRCPSNVNCVWEGRATANLTISTGGRTGGVNVTIPGLVGAGEGEREPVDALGYRFSLQALNPYPGSEAAENGAAPSALLYVEALPR